MLPFDPSINMCYTLFMHKSKLTKLKRKRAKLLIIAISFILSLTIIISSIVILRGGPPKQPISLATGEPAGHGLPVFITDCMVEALFETQLSHGIPVSTGLAMIIAEGGFGAHGPGGEANMGLSLLSYQYHNIFGIKYWPGMRYATGSVDMLTGEQTTEGETYYYDGNFAAFASYRDAIYKRAWMLMRSPYLEHIEPFLNPNDGSYTREQANAFMQGIHAGGWATDLLYTEKNIEHMVFYDLYRFDNMTFLEFWEERIQ